MVIRLHAAPTSPATRFIPLRERDHDLYFRHHTLDVHTCLPVLPPLPTLEPPLGFIRHSGACGVRCRIRDVHCCHISLHLTRFFFLCPNMVRAMAG